MAVPYRADAGAFCSPRLSVCVCDGCAPVCPCCPPQETPVVTKAARARKHKVYVPKPGLDALLTSLFAIECVFMAVTIPFEERLYADEMPAGPVFIACLVLCAFLIWAVRRASLTVASGLNAVLPYLGLVAKPPIVGKTQLNKWQDQSWQLVVHVSMTAAEVYLFVYDVPGLWTDSSLAWVPDPADHSTVPSTILQRFYLLQLVRGAPLPLPR